MIRALDGTSDPRWREAVLRHPSSSVFHTPEWLEALRRTYGFAPVVYAAGGPQSDVSGGIPFCRVDSWLTGRRLVSLPFSDHCQPLVGGAELEEILDHLQRASRESALRYVELRPLVTESPDSFDRSGFVRQGSQYHHQLDIRADADALFKGIASALRYDVRRAERAALEYAVGRDRHMVGGYFRLHLLTRSKQGVPPQPRVWFENLAASLGEMLDIHLLLQDGAPVAGVVTILFRDQLMWKYIASDPLRNGAGMGKWLLWKSICRGKEQGATTLDMGRCDPENLGLAQFKERWGAPRADLSYLRFPSAPAKSGRSTWMSDAAKSVVPRLPTSLLAAAGRIAYRHVG
jgi:hypothetical protein